MAKEKKSDDHYVELPEGINKRQMMALVEAAATDVGLYVSHIGKYSRNKYPDSVHWHFKRDPKEPGLLDATFWDVETLFWLMVRHREPQWVHDTVPALLRALKKAIRRLTVQERARKKAPANHRSDR